MQLNQAHILDEEALIDNKVCITEYQISDRAVEKTWISS